MAKHIYRFFGQRSSTETWLITGEECQHLNKVLRLQIGDQVEVFDGSGHVATGELIATDKTQAIVETTNEQLEPLPATQVAILLGMLRPAGIEEVLAPLIEVGVSSVFIFAQEHAPYLTEKVAERWHRIAVAACKQCKRARVPEIAHWPNLESALDAMQNRYQHHFFLDPEAKPSLLDPVLTGSSLAVVGSEGGFTSHEDALLRERTFVGMRLGPFILRAKTAAVVAASILVTRGLR